MSAVKQYRKKPVVIEAMHFATDNDDGACMNNIVAWVRENGFQAHHDNTTITIPTLEGDIKASCGSLVGGTGRMIALSEMPVQFRFAGRG